MPDFQSEPGVRFGEQPPQEAQEAMKAGRHEHFWSFPANGTRECLWCFAAIPLGEPATQPAEGETAQ